MKNSEEMIKSLFERREEYIKEQKKKRKKILVVTMSFAVCFLTTAVVGIPMLLNDGESTSLFVNEGITSGAENKNNTSAYESKEVADTENSISYIEKEGVSATETDTNPSDNVKTTYLDKNENTTSHKNDVIKFYSGKIKISLFEATLKSSDTDSFGEDELRHIDVTLEGYKFYTQLKESDYDKYGIEKYLKRADYGKKLGVITETDGSSEALKTPCSQEPTLAGCEVYLYEPVESEAVIIVDGNGHCSLFYFSDFCEEGHGYSEQYEVFNVSSSKDIKRIDYSVCRPDGTIIVTSENGSVTDENDINNFMRITKSLKPYIMKSALSGDPEWLNEARENYNKNNEKRVRIEASVVLKNGLRIPFEYEPNLGTGFVSGHFFLSEKDNSVLRKIFQQ